MAWRKPPSLFAKVLETGLWFAVLVCLATIGIRMVEARQTELAADSLQPSTSLSMDVTPVRAGGVLGRLLIEEVGLSVPVVESYDPAALAHGVGHVPGTAVPGGLGNLVLAGHRDTYFRLLRNVKIGMKVDVVSSTGRWQYKIDSTEVVTPDRVDVLEIGDRPSMTLITCYPFGYVGPAPKRFIVSAHLLSADSE